MRTIMIELSKIFHFPCKNLKLKCTIFEDNKGAEELYKVPKHSPRTKHIAVKYHHFRKWLNKGILIIKRVDTHEQQDDILKNH